MLQPKVAVSCCTLCKVQCECFTTKGGCVLLHAMQGTVWMLYNQRWLHPVACYARYSVNALQPKVAVSCCTLCNVQCECFTAESNCCAVMHGTAEGKCVLLCGYAQYSVNALQPKVNVLYFSLYNQLTCSVVLLCTVQWVHFKLAHNALHTNAQYFWTSSIWHW